MKIFVKEQLSEHKYKTPQGYLICTDAIIARTGKQTYKKSTFFPDAQDADSDIEVDRHEKDVFDEKTMASFENMPITIDHPDEEVNSTNNKEYSVGYVRDVHKGEFEGKPVMMANLIFTDETAIQKIENGEMLELSCGYDCDVKDENNPYQTNIRGNHVALCQRGRAGIARIQDSVVDTEVKDANKSVEHLISYFNAWGYPVRKELQEVVNYYRMSKSDVDKVFGPRIGRTYSKEELASLHTYDSYVDDALVANEQELNFIKNARQIKNANGILFVLKNDDEGYASPDGRQWYSGRVRVLPERDGGRKQNSRWLRVSFNGREAVMSLAKLKYASQYGDIPSGYEVDHLNGNHMDDRMSNYELVTSTENGIRNRVRQAARRQQEMNGAVSRNDITKAFGKYELDLLEKYNDYDRFTFKDSINDNYYGTLPKEKRYHYRGWTILDVGYSSAPYSIEGYPYAKEFRSLDEAKKFIKENLTNDSMEDRNMTKDTHEFRLAKKKNDYDEYVVKEYVNGKYREDGSYYTDDWEDAVGTLKDIAKRLGLTVKQHGSGYIADAITDKLVEEPKAWAEMKTNIIAKGYKLDKEGKTLFGRHHLEFISNNIIDANDFRNECAKLDDVVSKVENKYGTPSTYNFGLDNSGKLHAVIDIDSKYVKDEMPDAVKTALKVVNCKK